MNSQQRRQQVLDALKYSKQPLSGTSIAKQFDVSRQVIVQDIALLRATGENIISTNQGYVLISNSQVSKVFKVIHSDEDAQKELNLIVDCGGQVKDVFVYHKVYGVVKADMDIKSRLDVERYLSEISSGKSSLLKKITSDYHYHTVIAPSETILSLIEEKLWEAGFLAKLQDYEPVKFGK